MADRPFIIGGYAVRHRTTSSNEDRYSGVLRGIEGQSEKVVVNTTTDRRDVLEQVLKLAIKSDADLAEVVSNLSGDALADSLKEQREKIASASRLLRQIAPGVISENDSLLRMCEKIAGYVQSVKDEADVKGGYVDAFTTSQNTCAPSRDALELQLQLANDQIQELNVRNDELHKHNTYLEGRNTDLANDNRALQNGSDSTQYVLINDMSESVIVKSGQIPVFTWEALRKALAEKESTYSDADERVDCYLTEFVTKNYSAVFGQDFPLGDDPETVKSELDALSDWISRAEIDQQSYRVVREICSVAFDESNSLDAVDAGYATAIVTDVLAPKSAIQQHLRDGVFIAVEDGDDADFMLAVEYLLKSV